MNIGIIGTGSIVKNYARCIRELDNARLSALYTKSASRKESAEKEFGVPVFSTMDAFLKNDLDLVCVCNESGRHGEVIKAVARAGKHILCEKPLETTIEKIDEIIALCKAQNVKLGCTLQNRCTPDYERTVKAVRSGQLGKLVMGNAHINWYRNESYYADSDWKGTLKLDGGAAFINQAIHTIDLLLNLMGPVTSVFGKVSTLVHAIEGEDVGAGIVNFENGAIGTITAGTALYPGYPERIEIFGEKGSILMESGNIKALNLKNTPDKAAPSSDFHGTGASDPTAISHENHKKVIADMIDAIANDRAPMVEGAEARKAVAVITAIYKSSEKQELVFL